MTGSLLSVVLFCSAVVLGQADYLTASLPTVDGTSGTLNVAIVIMPGIFISEATIPFDVFRHIPARDNGEARMNTFFVAENMNPVTTYYGTRLKPHYTFANSPTVDILVMPSGIGSHHTFLTSWYNGVTVNGVTTGKTSNNVDVIAYASSTALISYVTTAAASAKLVTSHCWGAFTLADAGILNGQIATTFPGYTDTLKQQYPLISQVVDDQRMVVSGKILTSNGGLAAFEACLFVVRHIYGDAIAKKNVEEALVFSPDNKGHAKREFYRPSPASSDTLAAFSGTPLNVAILLLDGTFISEPAGPFDVLAHSPNMGKMNVFFVGEDMSTKMTYYGAEMYPDYTFANSPKVDVLVIPSGIGSHHSFLTSWYGGTTTNGVVTGKTTNDVPVSYYGSNAALISWVQASAATASYVTSHCWGAFTLADAGLLDGKTATTFPGYFDTLKNNYPAIKEVITNNRIVQDGKIITSNGGVAAYEAANYLLKVIYGETMSKKLALGLVYAKDNYDYINSAHVATSSQDSGTDSTAKVVEITFPGTLSSLTETQQTQMKDAVKAALPVISGITYSIELRSGSIIAKVTITGTSTAAAAQQLKTTVTATPLSMVVGGQTYTSTGFVVVDENSASMALTLSCKYSTLGLVLMMLGLACS